MYLPTLPTNTSLVSVYVESIESDFSYGENLDVTATVRERFGSKRRGTVLLDMANIKELNSSQLDYPVYVRESDVEWEEPEVAYYLKGHRDDFYIRY